jgi:hypothetical protein
LGHGVGVGLLDGGVSSESSDENQKRASRQVEIGNEPINDLKLKTLADEEAGFKGAGDELPLVQGGNTFEGSAGCGTYSDHASALAAGFFNLVDGGLGDKTRFGMEFMIGYAGGVHGAESADAYMKFQGGGFDAVLLELLEEL